MLPVQQKKWIHWEDDWKSRGTCVGQTVPEMDYRPGECGLGECDLGNDLIIFEPRWPVQFVLITHVLRNTLLMSIGANGQWGAVS